MRKITLALSAAALAIAGAAVAQPGAQTGAMGPGGPGAGKSPSTRAEMTKHLDEMFAQLDTNKDGKLDAKDREAREAERFAQLDKDGNGSLSLQEFSAARPGPGGPGMRGPGGPGGKRMGMAPDGPPPMGGKGEGRGKGMKGHRAMGPGGPGAMMDPMAADTDKDGAISREEFKAAALARFDEADTNRDGTISKAERQAAKQDRKAERRAARQAPNAKPTK
ncbi:MAG TPA: EF-hand domain-containing protein [Sphingomonadaceae bacterium]|nr:EF-hand domain-containing protein [Sphingomonadaceae bacterium]